MTIPKHPLHAQFDEILAEIFEVKKLSLIIKIDEELTDIFKVKGKAQFPKRQWKDE